MLSALAPPSRRRLIDWLLIGLLVTIAFLLGCYEMADSDIWWHLSGGRWILEHGRAPEFDPFTFGSQDRQWVDIHWAFEVLATVIYQLAAVPGLVLLAATAGALAVLACMTARKPDWPIVITILVWSPALVLVSWRFDPRPEIFSLLYIGLFLAILWRVDRRPALAWLLPVIQVLWVNTQGLFILGPILFACYFAERIWRTFWGARTDSIEQAPSWRRHVVGAGIAVAAACLASPYGLDAVRFPFDLFPKVAAQGNVYKEYIDELASPRRLVEKSGVHIIENWYLRSQSLLLLLLPVSFAAPAVLRAWGSGSSKSRQSKNAAFDPRAWIVAFAVIVGLLVIQVCFPPNMAEAMAVDGKLVSGLLFILVGVLSIVTARRSRPAAFVMLIAGIAEFAWMRWLDVELLSSHGPGEPIGHASLMWLAMGGFVFGMMLVRFGASVFRLLLAAAFTYLALQAIQNSSRFGLVAATVICWNLGEWLSELAPARATMTASDVAARFGLGTLLVFWIITIVTDRYHGWTGERRHFSLREQPFEFAHDAIRFAGRPGQAERSLVYDLGQTGLYDFYNAPMHKTYMDGRLEMPALETFETYVAIEDWLDRHDSRWREAVHRLGDPLLLLTHWQSFNGEAALLADPDWRCIYYDALASVFVPCARTDLLKPFPSIDFAERHFGNAAAPSIPDQPGAAFREMRGLCNLAASLRRSKASPWNSRIPILLHSLDRGSIALAQEPARHAVWTLLGNTYWNLVPNLSKPPSGPSDEWDPTSGLLWAQSTYCFRRALELAPQDSTTRRYLIDSFGVRKMADSQIAAGERLSQSGSTIGRFHNATQPTSGQTAATQSSPLPAINFFLSQLRPEAAVQTWEQAGARPTWQIAERIGGAYMHLGRPAAARELWRQALDPPSEALRQCRIADTYWIEGDIVTASKLYKEALAADPHQGDGLWALAMLYTQLGQAQPALEACRRAQNEPTLQRKQRELNELADLLARYTHTR
jgi:hypothetical protein